MTYDPWAQARTRVVRLKKWQVILISAGVAAFLIALAVVAAGIFLVVFPAILVIGLIWRFFGGRSKKASGNWAARNPSSQENASQSRQRQIVDAEYVVLTETRRDNRP